MYDGFGHAAQCRNFDRQTPVRYRMGLSSSRTWEGNNVPRLGESFGLLARTFPNNSFSYIPESLTGFKARVDWSLDSLMISSCGRMNALFPSP